MNVVPAGKVVVAALALIFVGTGSAHHSESMFSPNPTWIAGKVVEFAAINPHSIVTVKATTADGSVRSWAVEGLTGSQLAGRGIGPRFLAPGDDVEICAFPRRQRSASSAAPEFVHGLVLKRNAGELMIWGNYGKLTNCVRPGDEVGVWASFLGSDELAYAEWCWKSAEIPTQEASRALVGEIDDLIGNPCG